MFFKSLVRLSSCALLASAAMVVHATNHPLFSAYPDAKTRKYQAVNYERFELPTSPLTTDPAPTKLSLTGDLYQHFYTINGVSSLKVFENYAAAAKRAGFTPIFTCEADACGTSTQVRTLGAAVSVEASVYNYHHQPYYLVAEKQTDSGKIYAA